MTWLFFVTFYLVTDKLPWWGWALFAACVVWDHLKEKRDLKRPMYVIVVQPEPEKKPEPRVDHCSEALDLTTPWHY
jgi:hypothetical protein